MKSQRLNLFLLFFSFLLIISCTDDNSQNENSNVNRNKIDNVLSITNAEDQKIAFRLLNENEKYTLWTEKLKNIISNDNLNDDQKNLINDVLVKMKPIVFSDVKSDYDEYFTNIISKEFVNNSVKLFTKKQIREYFFQINMYSKLPGEFGGGGGDPIPSCNCNNAIIGGWDCEIAYACKKTGVTCGGDYMDCGVFNTSPCDGICKFNF